MLRNTLRAFAALALLAAMAAPTNLAAQVPVENERPQDETVTVYVDNGNWLDVRVYAVNESGAVDRVGTVTSFSSRKFELSRHVTSPNSQIQFYAVPIGSRERFNAPPVLVSEGDVVEWKLANNLRLSTIWVRGA